MKTRVVSALAFSVRTGNRRSQPICLRVLLWACCVVLLAQSLAPPGYMPGSLANGWPVVLCPEGLPAGFLSDSTHAHHHHGGGPAGEGDSAGPSSADAHAYCPLGSALDQPFLTSSTAPVGETPDFFLVLRTDLHRAVNPSRYSRYHPRDPPRSIV